MKYPLPRKFLLIEGRNLGDAVIGTSLVNSLGPSFPGAEVHVWTRPNFKELYDGNPHVTRQHHAHFPMGTVKNFGPASAWRLMRSIRALRADRFDVCVNAAGDFRENLLGWIVGAQKNVAVVWPTAHRYRRLVRPGLLGLVDQRVSVPLEIFNVYAIREHLARNLGCTLIRGPSLPVTPLPRGDGPFQVGIHPYASQRSKLWPWENWRRLIPRLRTMGCEIRIFCAPGERPVVESELAVCCADAGVTLRSDPLRRFFQQLTGLDLMVALDSFAVHAAFAVGTPTVLLNGGNDIDVWVPPGSMALSKGGICPWFPCFNKPRCQRSSAPYVCLSTLTVDEVAEAVGRRLDVCRRLE